MKICIGIPNGGRVVSCLLTDIIVNMMELAGHSWLLANVEGSLGPRNRWQAAKQAVEGKCDYLWLVDNDMHIPAGTLKKLLAENKAIIGAAYNYRQLPKVSVVKTLNDKGEVTIWDPSTMPEKPFVCHAIGSGCKLIQTSALRQIPQPWFALAWNEAGDLSKTDDVWFCEQAQSVGYEIWCDPTLGVSHIGDFPY